MTDQERKLQKAEVIRDFQEATEYLNALKVQAQRTADVCQTVARLLENNPSALENLARSTNTNIPSGVPSISAGELDRAVNVERLMNLCREIGMTERRLIRLAEQKRLLGLD